MSASPKSEAESTLTLFLSGDVMLGRGIDQILPHPGDPSLFEPFVRSARDYLELAERRSGPVPAPVGFDYVWGDGLTELERRQPDLRLINLETAVTKSGTPEPKGINYRMNPANIGVLHAAGIRACVLANNHVLDWGRDGLLETFETLEQAGIGFTGAGRTAREAAAPLVVEVAPHRRVIVLSFGAPSAGVPDSWEAGSDRPGINLLPVDPDTAVGRIRDSLRNIRRPGDIVVASVHWGSNWGYRIPARQRALAHRIIDDGDVDIVHGHSSHHPRPIEVYRGKLILYGCGDLINDYEGIGGYEEFRGDLSLMYFPRVSTADGKLQALDMVPFRIRKMRLERTGIDAAGWLAATLNRESMTPDTRIETCPDAGLRLVWT
jgi:poly-gamma-glutamate synthesis protein (capsule biosynthesis protein)